MRTTHELRLVLTDYAHIPPFCVCMYKVDAARYMECNCVDVEAVSDQPEETKLLCAKFPLYSLQLGTTDVENAVRLLLGGTNKSGGI